MTQSTVQTISNVYQNISAKRLLQSVLTIVSHLQITKVLDLYTGGLAVGLTCQDPSTLRGVELPADSSDLVNFPDMYVGIKDVANKPPVNTKLSFWVSDKGE